MSTLRSFGELIKMVTFAYIVGGIVYWATVEVFLRYIGKKTMFNPLISVLLVVFFWPMNIYADLKMDRSHVSRCCRHLGHSGFSVSASAEISSSAIWMTTMVEALKSW